jgi:hypothetical protein
MSNKITCIKLDFFHQVKLLASNLITCIKSLLTYLDTCIYLDIPIYLDILIYLDIPIYLDILIYLDIPIQGVQTRYDIL